MCNRSAKPRGVEVVDNTHCSCEDFSEWMGRQLHPSDVRKVDFAQDCEGTLWQIDDEVSYWRPGGKKMKERRWYNATVASIKQVRFSKGWHTAVELN